MSTGGNSTGKFMSFAVTQVQYLFLVICIVVQWEFVVEYHC